MHILARLVPRRPSRASTAVIRLVIAALVSAPPGVKALQADGRPDERKWIGAIRLLANENIVVDGDLSDGIWTRLSFTGDFAQKEPNQGAAPSVGTEVAIAYDDDALYLAARMHGHPESAPPIVTGRDDPGVAEMLVLSLDTFLDGRTAYSFGITRAGARLDWHHPDDNETLRDFTFDAVWTAMTRTSPTGWTAEFRIPFSQLRFSMGSEMVWGVNLSRSIPALNEEIFWSVVPRDQEGWSSFFGELRGITGISPKARLEFRPFVAGATTVTSEELVNPANPFAERSHQNLRVGMGAKMGIGSSFTLDATLNPDFGQVDLDPFVVNLGAFETVFDEGRPFFTEGASMFSLSGDLAPRYFFSRRIGDRPPSISQLDFADAPLHTGILGAAKITGRTRNGLTVGGLIALTDRETARFASVDGARSELEVVPLTGWGVLRINRDVSESGSTVGATLTSMTRASPADVEARSLLPRRAFAGGIDWMVRLREGVYEVTGHLGWSRIAGDSSAINRIQRSSRHYFQRPDQTHVRLDPSGSSMAGSSAAIRVEKRSGDRWLWNIGVEAATPGWEINDVGQRMRSDEVEARWSVTLRETESNGLFRRWAIEAQGGAGWNFGGVRRSTWMTLENRLVWPNFFETTARVGYVLPATSDDLTRGGPLVRRPHDWVASVAVANGSASRVRWTARVFRGNLYLEPDWFLDTSLGFAATSRWHLATSPRYNRRGSRLQYIDEMDGGPPATFGRRYVYATSLIEEAALPLSVSYSVTPDLSLTLAGELFAASGRFSNLGELADPVRGQLRYYGTDGSFVWRRPATELERGGYLIRDGEASFEVPDHDFSVRSLRSNFVIRWEWASGSSALLAWRQDREVPTNMANHLGAGAFLESISAPGTHTLVLKVNKWISFD